MRIHFGTPTMASVHVLSGLFEAVPASTPPTLDLVCLNASVGLVAVGFACASH